MKNFMLVSKLLLILSLCWFSISTADAGTTRYAHGVVLAGQAPFSCAEMDYGGCPDDGFKERYWRWVWTKTGSDNDVRGDQLYSKNNCGCDDPESVDIDVTIGAENSYTFSASTSWTAGGQLEWGIVKDVFGVSANGSYTSSNSQSWSNSQFTQTTVPVTCDTPADKRYRHYMLWDVHTDTYTGPEYVHCYFINGDCSLHSSDGGSTGNKIGIHKQRSLYGDSDPVDLGCP